MGTGTEAAVKSQKVVTMTTRAEQTRGAPKRQAVAATSPAAAPRPGAAPKSGIFFFFRLHVRGGVWCGHASATQPWPGSPHGRHSPVAGADVVLWIPELLRGVEVAGHVGVGPWLARLILARVGLPFACRVSVI